MGLPPTLPLPPFRATRGQGTSAITRPTNGSRVEGSRAEPPRRRRAVCPRGRRWPGGAAECGEVGAASGFDVGAGPASDIEEAPYFSARWQTVPAALGGHVVVLTDRRDRSQRGQGGNR